MGQKKASKIKRKAAKSIRKPISKKLAAKATAKRKAKTARAKKKVAPKAKTSRVYSPTTLKKLGMLSRNLCAYPDCTNRLVEQGISSGAKEIVGYICHIYAASDAGPRGKVGLTSKEKNAFENLILMCGVHHPKVDKLYQEYPAGLLLEWKCNHEAKALDNTPESTKEEQEAQKHAFFVEISDAKIEEELRTIRQGRFIEGFPSVDRALVLATEVERVKFSSGHNEVRARALAWCARILSQGETRDRATELLRRSRELAITPEAALAEIFLLPKGEKVKALQGLQKLNSLEAKSAMQRIVTNEEGNEAAYQWAKAASLSVDSFDAEGKFLFIMNALVSHDWDAALSSAERVVDADFDECPAVLHAVAMAKLVSAVDPDLRPIMLSQLPFDADSFPLSSKPEDLTRRKEARALFSKISNFATRIGVGSASNVASDYALWLGLRDAETEAAALEELRQSMSDATASLRRVNLALRFGIKIDLKAIEARLDQSLSLSGGLGTGDEAFARFSIALTQKGPKAVADYVAKHRAQLNEHLHKTSIILLEVEALSKAGMLDTARERLKEAVAEGLPEKERKSLERIIAESSGSDPIAGRREIYEERKDLTSLAIFVNGLEDAQLYQELRPYAEELFGRTKAIADCERVARCLNEASEYGDLAKFMVANKDLISQSEYLKTLDAWTHYREGDYSASRIAVSKLTDDIKNPNVRRLRVNLAIASGAWDEILGYANEVWTHRAELSSQELLQAANLSMSANGPHSKDLVLAAVEKEPENPQVLASAYFLATNAGWEQDATVSGWMTKAAEKSGDEGPIKMVSLNELVNIQPDWNKKSSNVWDQLKMGQVPVFTAAQALNRSLLDFYLTPALLNPAEMDVRRRNIIFGFSGARGEAAPLDLKTVALDFAALLTLSQLGVLDTVLNLFEVIVPNTTLGWLFQEKQKTVFHQPSRIKDAGLLKGLLASKALEVLNTEGFDNDPLRREVGNELSAMLTAAKLRSVEERKVVVIHGAPIHKIGSLMMEEADVSGYTEHLASPFALLERLKEAAALLPDEEARAKNYLSLHVRPWPNEPAITDNTDVYLDGLAISNLRAAGLLEHLKKAGVRLFVEKSEIEEADQLIALGSLGSQQTAAIEALRSCLATALTEGRARAVRADNFDEEEDNQLKLHPTYAVLSFTGKADAIVVDDRFINRHQTMTAPDGSSSPVLSSLDLLVMCEAAGKISKDTYFLLRNRLRRWGYQFIPVTDAELLHHLASAKYVNGNIVENAGLKVIRESLLRARMAKLMQVPVEMPYLQQSLGAYIRAMKQKWVSGPVDEAKALGEYVLNLTDIRAWAPSVQPGSERRFAVVGHAGHVISIFNPPNGIDPARRDEFFQWVDEALIKHIKDNQPEVFEEIIEQFKKVCLEASDYTAQKMAAEADDED